MSICHVPGLKKIAEVRHLFGGGRAEGPFGEMLRCWNVERGTPIIYSSGKLTFCYGKSPFLVGKLTISMAIFNSYVKLPEGIALNSYGSYDHKQPEYS